MGKQNVWSEKQVLQDNACLIPCAKPEGKKKKDNISGALREIEVLAAANLV